MEYILKIFTNEPLIAAVIGWALAQILKVIGTSIMERRFAISILFASGGMPSSHSAFVSALTIVIAENYGFDSVYFAIAASFALVVMYDACGVRRAVGEHAKALNRMFEALQENTAIGSEKALKEILGHSPFQVTMGALLGIGVGLLFIFF